MRKRAFFITLQNLEDEPYGDLLVPYLVRSGWRVTVAAPGVSKSVLRTVMSYECEAVEIPRPGGVPAHQREMQLAKLLAMGRGSSFDVCYLASQGIATRAGLWASVGIRPKRCVYQTYDFRDPRNGKLQSTFERVLYRTCAVHLNGEVHRGMVYEHLYERHKPAVIVPPALPRDWPVFPKSEERRRRMDLGRPDQFVLLSHGGYHPLRNSAQLLKAVAMLPKNVTVAFTGADRPHREFDSLISELGIADRVVRLPRLPFQEMLTYTCNADLGILLYVDNDLGNYFQIPGRLSEYTSQGLPILTSNFVGLENLVLKHGIGVAVEQNAAAIAAGILDFMQRRADPGHVRQIFRNKLAFDHFAGAAIDSFNGLVSEGQA